MMSWLAATCRLCLPRLAPPAAAPAAPTPALAPAPVAALGAGRHVLVIGPPRSGRTGQALAALAWAQQQGRAAAWISPWRAPPAACFRARRARRAGMPWLRPGGLAEALGLAAAFAAALPGSVLALDDVGALDDDATCAAWRALAAGLAARGCLAVIVVDRARPPVGLSHFAPPRRSMTHPAIFLTAPGARGTHMVPHP